MAQIYARSMCSRCYYKCSRLKRASKCQHKDTRPHYSKGLCRECYLRFYYKQRKEKKEQQMMAAEMAERSGPHSPQAAD